MQVERNSDTLIITTDLQEMPARVWPGLNPIVDEILAAVEEALDVGPLDKVQIRAGGKTASTPAAGITRRIIVSAMLAAARPAQPSN
jgi:hypothetical protein